MNIDKLVKSKADQKLIDVNPLFFKKCLKSFQYLMPHFGFDRARLDVSGRECSVTFSNRKSRVQIIHEIGLLPRLCLKDKDGNGVDLRKIMPELEDHISRDNFPVHFKVQDVINIRYNSTKDYIKAMGQAWDKNKETGLLEVEKCLDLYSMKLHEKLTRILQ